MTAAATPAPVFDPRTVPVRFSYLKHMHRSPRHYLDAMLADMTSDGEETAPMRIGYTAHAMVLGGDFVVYDGDRRGKAWSEFKAANDGRRIVTATEAGRARRIADAVLAEPAAVELLKGKHEYEAKWSQLGRSCLGHIDILHPERVVDLKTTNDANPERFARQAIRMGYHAQLAWYAGAMQVQDAYVIAVESKRPYAVTCLKLTPRALEQGRKLCRLWMERLLVCEQSNHWPAYCESVVDFDVPDDEFELQFADDNNGAEPGALPF